MDEPPLLLLVFLSSALINTYPWTRHKPYVLILLSAAPSWAAAVTQLPHGWVTTIFGSILSSALIKTYPKTHHKPYLLILLLAAPSWAVAVTQLPYMDWSPLFLVAYLSSTPIKTYPETRHKLYLLIILLVARSWAAADTQLQCGWVATIFGTIFELSTHENLPLDTSQALSTHSTLGHSQLSCSCYSAAIWMGRHYFWEHFWAQYP